MDYTYIDKNVEEIKKRIREAEIRSGREGVLLLAAVKYATPEEIDRLLSLGIRDIGENRVQQLLEHYDAISDRENVNIHFIGTLQTNKVKYIIDKVCLIHSVDSVKLAAEIDKQAKKHGKVMDVLIEINSGEEEAKSGVLPRDAEALCMEISKFSNINLKGFMTMAPKCEKKEEYYKYFRKTYENVLDIWTKKLHNIGRPIISMGMSESFEEAIVSGSDIVRIGRSLFIK
ncbi:MAG: YggS family pyridoxal phosphate-dependent enzyme [Clostridia bacterium]|nr:YggS family pyridoxal phosphate-dependent enzyme [Clostridia bacterium]